MNVLCCVYVNVGSQLVTSPGTNRFSFLILIRTCKFVFVFTQIREFMKCEWVPPKQRDTNSCLAGLLRLKCCA